MTDFWWRPPLYCLFVTLIDRVLGDNYTRHASGADQKKTPERANPMTAANADRRYCLIGR